MSVSGNKGSLSGLNEALRLIDICEDPKKYKKLLEPLVESANKADETWKKVKLAGNIGKLAEEAQKDREQAAQERAEAQEAYRIKEAQLDRDYSLKAARLREKEEALDHRQATFEDEMAVNQSFVEAETKRLEDLEKRLTARERRLDRKQEELKTTTDALNQRRKALEEAWNG